MAFDRDEIGAEHTTVKAGEDLRSFQHFAVKITAAGVLRSFANATSGPTFVLMNRPNSGEAASLYGAPNVAKAIAAVALTPGQLVTDTGSSAFTNVASMGSPAVGYSHDSVSSGSVFALRLL